MKFSEDSMFNEGVDLKSSHWIKILSNKSVPVSILKSRTSSLIVLRIDSIVDVKKRTTNKQMLDLKILLSYIF